MPIWLIWMAGAGAAGWLFGQAGDAAEQTGNAFDKAGKWAVIGLAVYFGGKMMLRGR